MDSLPLSERVNEKQKQNTSRERDLKEQRASFTDQSRRVILARLFHPSLLNKNVYQPARSNRGKKFLIARAEEERLPVATILFSRREANCEDHLLTYQSASKSYS
jgi:hypothetical protein